MSRAPQTCGDCARRKIKCNKVIPCDQCDKRGISHMCRRAEITHTDRSRPLDSMSPGASDTSLTFSRPPRSGETPINEKILSLVTTLSERVKRLEAKLEPPSPRKRALYDGIGAPSEPSAAISAPPDRPPKRVRVHEIIDSSHSSPTARERQLHVDDDLASSHNGSDAEVEDAATVLEYLAWGRLKDSTLTSGLRNPSITHVPEPPMQPDRDILKSAHSLGSGWNPSPATTSGESMLLESSQISQIQERLPTMAQVYLMFEYCSEHLLFQHCGYHTPTMRREIDQFYQDERGIIGLTSAALQWTALLFGVICSSMTCATSKKIMEWGFKKEDQSMLAKRYFQAYLECLNAGRYQQYQNIYAVQAITASTISAHILGFSNSQSVNLASAIRIAQSLGMHRLGKSKGPPEDDNPGSLAEVVKEELSRRIWQQLATQDWFSVPFAETYCINPLHFNTRQPQHCDEETMRPVPFSEPSLVVFGNFFFRIASLMPALLDRYYEAPTLDAKYEHVLRFDKMTRELVLSQLPPYLYSQTPVDPSWPPWVLLARKALSISAAHKIIMIHRRFLGMSFHDKRFDFTRRTCLSAAKTIINEIKSGDFENSPIFWTTQAFSVAAGIILALDNFNRHQSTREHEENRQLITETISILSKSVYISSIAARGSRLLTELLAEDRNYGQGNGKERADDTNSISSKKHEKTLNVTAFVKKFCEMEIPAPPQETPQMPAEHIPLWLQQDHNYQPPSYGYGQEGNINAGNGYSGYPPRAAQQQGAYGGLEQGYHMPSHFRRHHGAPENPFSLVTDNFDISSVTWFDDLLGLAPSNSI